MAGRGKDDDDWVILLSFFDDLFLLLRQSYFLPQWLGEGNENFREDGLRMPEVRDADAVTAAEAAAVAVDDVTGSAVFLDEFVLDGSLTDLDAMRREGILLPIPELLLPLPGSPAVDADPFSSSPADLLFFCCCWSCRWTAAGWERVFLSAGFQISLPIEELWPRVIMSSRIQMARIAFAAHVFSGCNHTWVAWGDACRPGIWLHVMQWRCVLVQMCVYKWFVSECVDSVIALARVRVCVRVIVVLVRWLQQHQPKHFVTRWRSHPSSNFYVIRYCYCNCANI